MKQAIEPLLVCILDAIERHKSKNESPSLLAYNIGWFTNCNWFSQINAFKQTELYR